MANNVINSLTIGDNTGIFSLPIATCSTSTVTISKVATLLDNSKFVLQKGARILVNFKYPLLGSHMTLNVNNTGAKDVFYCGRSDKMPGGGGEGSMNSSMMEMVIS